MSTIVQILNVLISSAVAWIAYNLEMTVEQITTFLQTVTQLNSTIGLIARGILLLADFAVIFFIFSVIFDRLEPDD